MANLFAPAVTDLLPVLDLQLSVRPLSVDIICCWKNICYSVLVSEQHKTDVLIKQVCSCMCVVVSINPSHGHFLTFSTISRSEDYKLLSLN